jgi:DNA-directed RNA polymerase specialized sigma24 family protein
VFVTNERDTRHRPSPGAAPDRELEDLVQGVFARALEGIDRVREADKFRRSTAAT